MNVFDWINIAVGCIWGIYSGTKDWYIWNWRFFVPIMLFSAIITTIEFAFFR